MVGYLQKFMPNLSETNNILRQLCEDKVAFHYDQARQAAFDKFKKMVTKTPVLKFYDINKSVTVQTNASKFGIGFVIMQDEHPIAYASKALEKGSHRKGNASNSFCLPQIS